ncbi:hypothetical protein D6C90_08230 [Aureobasidium pullulans]|uniref:DUF7605 domain-containing protein n=1 Tax=Aureobasidium pullulans TaxID=5580 RepID=A0A4S9U6K6_AURPU|nr:hypothetical protein D6C99_04107 [Aureobasidium pullulans]THZ33604.1 hypothetical protein D6C90_08230 [Aureobasidium pullulans]
MKAPRLCAKNGLQIIITRDNRDLGGSRNRAVKAEIIEDEDEYMPDQDEIDDFEDFDDPTGASDQSDDDVDAGPEDMDAEPEQGEVLWSEGQEKYPRCPAYHEDVEKFGGRITEILDKIAEHLGAISEKSDGMKRLTRQAIEIRTFPAPKTPVIALMGDAGAGNASLNIPVKLHEADPFQGNFGRSCTCVITEYRKDFPNQTKKFAAKIEFLTNDQRGLLLKEHLGQYINYHFCNEEEWSFEEERDYRNEAKSAEGTFSDLFRGRPQFTGSEVIESYMKAVFDNDTMAATVTQFEKWCDELASDHALCAQTELIEADTAFQLSKVLSPFLSSSASWNDKPSLWPIVHKVSIGVKGPRLLQNAIIADLPGVSDVNKVRASTGKSYLVSSDYLWIVAPIARLATDTSVDALLYEYGNRFEGRLAVVCTKIDDPMVAQSFSQEYQDAAKPSMRLEGRIKKAKEQHNNAKASLRSARALATRRERGRRVDQCRARFQKLLNQRLEMMVEVRNKKVTALLYAEKADRLKKKDVDLVYCVSNKHYAWLKGYKDAGQEDAAQLSAVMTGIPRLRQYALTIPSHEIWSTFMNHIKHTSNGFVKALRIWATRTTKDNSTGLSGIREKSAETVRATLKTYKETLRGDSKKHLAEPMEEVYAKMSTKANGFLEEVRDWRWMTIRAFIRRNGTYNSKAVGHVSWNAKMMLPAAKFMNKGWNEMVLHEQGAMAIAQTSIMSALDTILVEVKAPMELLNIPLGHFKGFLEAQKHGIAHAFTNYREELEKELKIVKHLVDKDDSEGYFAKAMETIYQNTEPIRGTGYKNKVLGMLVDYVGQQDDDSPFIKMAKSTCKGVNRRVRTCLDELEASCLKIFDEIFLQFGCLIDEIPDDDGVVAETKLTLRDFLVDVDEEMEAMILRLQEIENDPGPQMVEEVSEPLPARIKPDMDNAASSSTNDSPVPAKKVKIEIKSEPEDEDDL